MRERESEKEELREKRRRESQRGWSFELSTSSMDPDSAQNGVSKKMGLARLAKARSISNSLNNLQFIDDNPEVVLTTPTQSPPSPLNLPSLPNDTLRAQEQHTEAQGSPLRSFNRQGAGVNLLPNKMNVSTLSGQPAEKKNKGTSPDDDVVSIDSSHGQVPCSDPDFIKGGKSGMKGSPSQQKIAAEVDKQSVKSDSMNSSDSPGKKSESSSGSSGFYSPMLARRSRLEPPKVKRSRSLTRLTEAINQIHNLCVFPAQPAVAPENQKGSSPPSSPSHQPVSLHLSAPEVMGAFTLTPLIATHSRIDRDRTQSPRLSRRSAFRETVQDRKQPSMYSLDSVVSQPSSCPDKNSSLEDITSLPPVANPSDSPPSLSRAFVVENGIDTSKAPGTKTPAVHTNGEALDSKKHGSEHRQSRQRSKSSKGKQKEKGTTNPKSGCVSAELKHASTVPSSLNAQGDYQSSKPSYVLVKKDEITKDSPRHDYRSASLDELTNIGVPVGLPILSPGDLKHKNYLFGGFSSLLGASELDRYIPKRSITIFIATWNMNGKEPPQNLEDFLLPEALEQVPDMYVVGTQESGGSRSEWEVRLQAAIGPSHCLFTSAIFGVLHLVIFLRRDLLWFCSVPEEATYSLRPGVAYKTKGGVGIGFQFFGTRMLFINSHLTAHEEKQQYRIQNFRNICHSLDIPRLLPHKFKNKDVTHRYDCVFWLGDLNFRLAVNREHVFERLKQPGLEAYQHLLQWDQLSQAQQKGEAFTEFTEGTITFPPTFKYDPGTDHYDTSSKQRVPSYTDRILFKSGRGAITCSSYNYCPLFRTSDHKPVSGVYECKIRPGKDDVPLAAGMFNRDVYLEALRRRRRFLYQPSLKNCPVQ
ncbi:phosphatidylinositol polyphosphate 5-phosphatase type IV-like isoform X2 [Penaeus japonicus]|uniref:phosphatidylinositol polyphosphate 5-phosphatase type IV-like isoform X2 n=1 Tax=Penaeus japonicus TaxID=27405 RepID=UPI001C713F32|nr:phosphatidylinositol polyphosphate 5-phosphatase type IV-like isoform X2 [Penaeus japonicus]